MLLLSLLLTEPQAGYSEGRSCVNSQIADSYLDGWRLRTAGAFEIEESDTRYYLVTLASTIEYKILACSDDAAEQIQLVVYNDSGRVLEVTEPDGRGADMTFSPPKSGSYFVGARVVQMADIAEPETRKEKREAKKSGAPKVGVGLGIMYR
ncbi:MAG TPA: hypothetical protein QGF58_22495 [Myxococcota bacterium]|nr:hypothetical protein [Myxococcota bacterium]